MQPTRNRPKRVIAIDFGLARIGMAISDERKIIAMPLETIKTEKGLEATVNKVAKEIKDGEARGGYDIEEIVIGMPYRMNGQVGLMADEVNLFINLLSQHINVPIVPVDERLTSVQADRSMREGNMRRKQRAQHVDQVAAVIILQTYLDMKGVGN